MEGPVSVLPPVEEDSPVDDSPDVEPVSEPDPVSEDVWLWDPLDTVSSLEDVWEDWVWVLGFKLLDWPVVGWTVEVGPQAVRANADKMPINDKSFNFIKPRSFRSFKHRYYNHSGNFWVTFAMIPLSMQSRLKRPLQSLIVHA